MRLIKFNTYEIVREFVALLSFISIVFGLNKVYKKLERLRGSGKVPSREPYYKSANIVVNSYDESYKDGIDIEAFKREYNLSKTPTDNEINKLITINDIMIKQHKDTINKEKEQLKKSIKFTNKASSSIGIPKTVYRKIRFDPTKMLTSLDERLTDLSKDADNVSIYKDRELTQVENIKLYKAYEQNYNSIKNNALAAKEFYKDNKNYIDSVDNLKKDTLDRIKLYDTLKSSKFPTPIQFKRTLLENELLFNKQTIIDKFAKEMDEIRALELEIKEKNETILNKPVKNKKETFDITKLLK